MRRIQAELTAEGRAIQSRAISRGKVAAKAFHTGLGDEKSLKETFYFNVTVDLHAVVKKILIQINFMYSLPGFLP